VPWKVSRQKQYQGKQFLVAEELRKIAGVEQVSVGAFPMRHGYLSGPLKYAGTDPTKKPLELQIYKKWVDTAYIGLYKMKLVAGRNLTASDTTNELVLNETAVKAFGFASPQDAIGKMIKQDNVPLPVVGVVSDFHQRDFYTNIDPVALMSNKWTGNINIKLSGNDPAQWQRTLKAIGQKWYSIYPPESLEYKFYDETLQEMYKQERNLSKLINMATAISILISCLGLFGLVTLTAYQRTKEIGIRKVLGASVAGIVSLLSSEFVKLVLIALVIATPIAWWAMSKWLQDFVYRIQIQWWMFALTGLSAVVIALLTVSVRAIRAALANPVKSLRSE
jgi:ABC-type antimicrobial peptide transport system permease subunit